MDTTAEFRRLHGGGFFVIPNAWDLGSAVILEKIGFPAIATTSSGFAASLGRGDQETTFDELCRHVAALVHVTEVPISVDGERLFADTPDGVAQNIGRIADLGAAGISIEDFDPVTGTIDDVDTAVIRVRAAAEVTSDRGMVLTARAENHLYGVDDLDDTIVRLSRYREAGADVVYAPGLVTESDIGRIVSEVPAPVNVLLMSRAPQPRRLAELGVRRASTGGRLSTIAYGAMAEAARASCAAKMDENARRRRNIRRDHGESTAQRNRSSRRSHRGERAYDTLGSWVTGWCFSASRSTPTLQT